MDCFNETFTVKITIHFHFVWTTEAQTFCQTSCLVFHRRNNNKEQKIIIVYNNNNDDDGNNTNIFICGSTLPVLFLTIIIYAFVMHL